MPPRRGCGGTSDIIKQNRNTITVTILLHRVKLRCKEKYIATKAQCVQYICVFSTLTPLEPQSRFRDKLLEIWLVCPHNGTAVLKAFYPSISSTTSVRADSSILLIEQIQVMCPESYATEILRWHVPVCSKAQQ